MHRKKFKFMFQVHFCLRFLNINNKNIISFINPYYQKFEVCFLSVCPCCSRWEQWRGSGAGGTWSGVRGPTNLPPDNKPELVAKLRINFNQPSITETFWASSLPKQHFIYKKCSTFQRWICCNGKFHGSGQLFS